MLGIPKDYSLEAIIPVGRPAEKKRKEPRLSLREVLFYNQWNNKAP